MPGDAFTSLLLNPQLPPDAYEKTIALYGLDKPLSERVIKYVQNFFKGDFGFSYGQYDDYGDNFSLSYGFGCGSYDCSVAYYDFMDDGYGGDEDAIVLSISASL